MANIIRSAKSGNDWTIMELRAYNIRVVDEDAATFFGHTNLPAPMVDPIILNNLETPPGPVTRPTRLFFHYLKDAMERFPPGPSTEAALNDFALHLLGLVGYDEPDRVIHQHMEIDFVMCGINVDAKLDICVLDDNGYSLLVQHDKHRRITDDPEPPLIANAIAAFYENNRIPWMCGLPVVRAKVFPGITFIGTAPTFYKIPITEELLDAITTGQFPTQETIVHRLVPPMHMARYFADGMQSLENRRIMLQCFEAFK